MESENINSGFQLSLKKQNLIIKLRGIILSASVEISETLKYGRITFVTDNDPVAFLCVKQDKDLVEVGFFKGALLNDPDELLKGKSREIRRIRITSENDIPVLQIKRWVRESVSLQLRNRKVKQAKSTEL